MQIKFTDCVDVVGSSCHKFDATKVYVSTGAVDIDHINYSNTEIVDYLNRPSRANLVANKNDILFAKMQATEKTLRINEALSEHIYSTGFCAVRAKNNIISNKCLYYLLTSENFLKQKDKNCSGATQKAITNVGLEKIIVSVPELEYQDAFVEQIEKICSLIEFRKQQLSKLDELVKVRFVEMFGDVIRNDKGWKQCRFSDITTSRLGKMLDAKQQTGKCSYPYLANFNVQWFRFELDKLNVMDFNEEDRKEFELIAGDLLVCEGGEIGRCAVWRNELQPCFFQKALHRVRCNQDIVKPDYLAYWFKYNCEHGGFSDIEGAKATIAHLTGEKLKCLRVTVPPIGLQNEFANFVEQIDKSKLSIQQSLEKLETLKKSLMQQYFG